jgi:ABC-type uncharacterized transport system ATPase subunit
MFFPLMDTSPEDGISRHPIMFKRVDFPDPEGPMMAMNSPGITFTVTPARACTSPEGSGYTFVTSLNSMTGSAIARSLVNDPPILLCDEPTGNLDTKTGKSIMDLLLELCTNQGKTIVMVTHDPKIAEYAARVIHIEDGLIRSDT